MFVENIEKTFGINTPILADEIVRLFNNYTRAYVFRLIKKAEKEGLLVSFSRGVYFIPRRTFFGQSTICSEMVAEKKYIKDKDSVYGIYSGLNLLNHFGVTTQVPNIIEIVTNNETTRKRTIEIYGRKFVLRRSKCKITKENYNTYTILQLFSDINIKDELSNQSRIQINNYMNEHGIINEKLFSMSKFFPALTIKNIVGSGILNVVV